VYQVGHIASQVRRTKEVNGMTMTPLNYQYCLNLNGHFIVLISLRFYRAMQSAYAKRGIATALAGRPSKPSVRLSVTLRMWYIGNIQK